MRVTALVRTPLPAATVARLAADLLRAERARLDALSITFVGPARMRRLNREHLGHDRVTDVIAFSLTPSLPDSLVGDVYICPAVAAKAEGAPLREELRRLVIHGVLHVLGHDHPAGNGRQSSPMWRRQERYLATLARGAR